MSHTWDPNVPPPDLYKPVGIYSHGDTESTVCNPQYNQVIPYQIQPTFITGVNLFSINSAVDKNLIGKYYSDLAKIYPPHIKYQTLISQTDWLQ